MIALLRDSNLHPRGRQRNRKAEMPGCFCRKFRAGRCITDKIRYKVTRPTQSAQNLISMVGFVLYSVLLLYLTLAEKTI